MFEQALAEIRAGAKRSHWMWFVLPQMRGLGHSAMAQRYGIASLEEARAYLAHPVLGARLVACIDALAALPIADPVALFGPIDAIKLRSCLTLFEAAGGGARFTGAIERWFGGARDAATLGLITRG
jgi:uncharacterized protein (DUF1810 family)